MWWALDSRALGGSDPWQSPYPRYSTIYTMFPVFSLVLDKDVKSEVAMLYPELYKDLLKVGFTAVAAPILSACV